MKKLLIFLFPFFLFAKTNDILYESSSNTIIKQDKIKNHNKKIDYEILFNKGVFYLEKRKYLKAIKYFKQSAKFLKIPSFLNIGISYYRLGSYKNSYLYLKKIYDLKPTLKYDPFSYISATYYIYLITKDRKYLSEIISSYQKISFSKLDNNTKRLVVDTFILLKKYKKAISLATTINNYENIKLALLYLITNNYKKADIYIKKTMGGVVDEQTYNNMLWFLLYINLKQNNIDVAKELLKDIDKRAYFFNSHKNFPIKLYFNPKKISYKDYQNRLVKFNNSRKIDIIFYFAPYIFIDKKILNKHIVYSFVLKNINNLNSLDILIKYNKSFVDLVKLDPIIRAKKLKTIINSKLTPSSYEYYNVGLAYAQIFDYKSAFDFFKRAYDLDRENKLYAIMSLISAKKANIKLNNEFKKDLDLKINQKGGRFSYIARYIYKIVYNPVLKLKRKDLTSDEYSSMFLKALYFMENSQKYGFLPDEPIFKDIKDPLVYLMSILIKQKNQNIFSFYAKVQDEIPKKYNEYFLNGPLFLTKYYLDMVLGYGILKLVDFNIGNLDRKQFPTYKLTKAYVNLYLQKDLNQSIQDVENLIDNYQINNIYTYYLLMALYLSINDYENGFAILDLLRFEYKNKDAKFLSGLALLKNLKLYSASNNFKNKYKNDFIDFKLLNIEKYLQKL